MNALSIRPPFLDPTLEDMLAQLPAARPALFLDRDGVVNVDRGYVHTPEQTQWLPEIFRIVEHAHVAGYLPVIVTNQAGIARGFYDEATFLAYTAWVHEEFRRRGVPLAATFYCPHHPEVGHEALRGLCECRKPASGMFVAAIAQLQLNASRSWMIGDMPHDLVAARGAGIGTQIHVSDASAWYHAPSGK